MKRLFLVVRLLALTLVLTLPAVARAEGKSALTWYGQSAFKLVTPSGKVLLIDPWIVNPVNKNGAKDLAALDKVDYILITHGHGDHVGNAVDIAKRTGAKLIANYDLGRALVQYGGFPEKLAERTGMGFPGGELNLLDGEVKILLVPAVHSSTLEAVAGTPLAGKVVYAGTPVGFVISVKGGPVIYHTGDTDLFNDMSLIGSLSQVDVMIACIGGHFTMGPERAALAAKLVHPATVIPMHFGTKPAAQGYPGRVQSRPGRAPHGRAAPGGAGDEGGGDAAFGREVAESWGSSQSKGSPAIAAAAPLLVSSLQLSASL